MGLIELSDQRIKIIVKEINYWKENKLLPVVYCDFLLALYTRGEDTESMEKSDELVSSNKSKLTLLILFQVFILLLGLLLSVVIIYASPLDMGLKTIILLLVLVVCSVIYFFQKILEIQ